MFFFSIRSINVKIKFNPKEILKISNMANEHDSKEHCLQLVQPKPCRPVVEKNYQHLLMTTSKYDQQLQEYLLLKRHSKLFQREIRCQMKPSDSKKRKLHFEMLCRCQYRRCIPSFMRYDMCENYYLLISPHFVYVLIFHCAVEKQICL